MKQTMYSNFITRIILSLCLLEISSTQAFFGFTETKPTIQKSTKSGCLGWRQTGNCDGHGPRESSKDLSCRHKIPSDRSGYCECAFGYVGRTACGHQPFSCEKMCLRGYKQMSSDEGFDWLQDTVWKWNNWREVKFQNDGLFWAPTAECEYNKCHWKVKNNKIFILWGNDGIHTVMPEEGKKKLSGIRYDGAKIFANFVRKEGFDNAVEADDDLYEVLGVDVDATEGEIRKAYRKLSRELHPDKVSDPTQREELETRFIKVQEAYEVLKEEDTRMVYDTGGMEAIKKIKDPNQQARGMDPFSMFFGGAAAGGSGSKGGDVRLQMEVDLAVLYTGGEVVHHFNRRVVCRRCSKITDKNRERCSKCNVKCPGERKMVQRRMGNMIVQQQEEMPSKERCKMEDAELHVEIEKGMKSGDEIKFERKNEQTPGQIPGDVIVQIQQRRHNNFRRVGQNDLKTLRRIGLKEALTGVDITFNHLDGHEVRIQTDARDIIYPRRVITLAEEGMPFHNFPSQKGNLLVEFEVVFPESLTQQQTEAIGRLF